MEKGREGSYARAHGLASIGLVVLVVGRSEVKACEEVKIAGGVDPLGTALSVDRSVMRAR